MPDYPPVDRLTPSSPHVTASMPAEGTATATTTGPGQERFVEEARITVRLSSEARAALEKIRELGSMDSMQEAIRRAIGMELFLMTEQRNGWKVLLQKGNQYREVIFPKI